MNEIKTAPGNITTLFKAQKMKILQRSSPLTGHVHLLVNTLLICISQQSPVLSKLDQRVDFIGQVQVFIVQTLQANTKVEIKNI